MKRIQNQYQIEMLARLGTLQYWTNKTYKVSMKRGVVYITHDNGYCETLLDDAGCMKDKCHEFFFEDLTVHGMPVKDRDDLTRAMENLRAIEGTILARKHEAMQGSTSLQTKIAHSKHFNKLIREAQDEHDYAMLHFWQLYDLL